MRPEESAALPGDRPEAQRLDRPLAVRRAPACGRPDRTGMLRAAAMLDALGVEVLGAVEALGASEAEVRLVHVVELVQPGRAVELPYAALWRLNDEARAAWAFRAVRCEAWKAG